ncbi:MAG TPA: peptidylprolyl isomerase [candidate division Zixibacteria bacterium]|nr:peptidylprolyl isomerase [candidate division Zixibacteria bacterium]
MKRLAALSLVAVLTTACGGPAETPPPCPAGAPSAEQAADVIGDVRSVEVTTNKGTFAIELASDAAPIAVANFVALARCGFYDGISFHRIIAGFVAQAGDPQTKQNRGDFAGLGTGGPGYRFVIEPPAEGLTYDPYVVAMANAGGTDTNGSQFFINLTDLDDRLDRLYTIIGRVTAGTEVIDEIGRVPTNGPRGVPLDPVIIERMTVQVPEAEE